MSHFNDVKNIILNLGYLPENINEQDELFTISDKDNGINNLIIDIEGSIVIMEQVVVPVSNNFDPMVLLKANREMVHGAFCLDENEERVIWRDTLEVENIDPNEVQGSINALALVMAENADMLLAMV
jgi:hypothetical protein